MKKYRKKGLVEVVEERGDGGRLIQNEGVPSDRWAIDKETFERTYEEVVEEENENVIV